jgi:hypothetical protein
LQLGNKTFENIFLGQILSPREDPFSQSGLAVTRRDGKRGVAKQASSSSHETGMRLGLLQLFLNTLTCTLFWAVRLGPAFYDWNPIEA